jgi:hypothetical protein
VFQVHKDIEAEFVEKMKSTILKNYGKGVMKRV